MRKLLARLTLPLLATTLALLPSSADAACCYFSAQNADILQPAQKAFLTWDPAEKVETFTVQPKFEGNALDFGMVIPTPTQPKLHEMPRDFFKHLAVYSIMKKRAFPHSRLLPQPPAASAPRVCWSVPISANSVSSSKNSPYEPRASSTSKYCCSVSRTCSADIATS